MKVVIVSHFIFPTNSPRSNRATELAKEFARQNNEVILYGAIGKYDYSEFEKENNLKIKNLGKNIFSKFTSDGKDGEEYFLTRAIRRLIGKYLYFPLIYLTFLTYKSLKREKNIDLLITVAYPFSIHWGGALLKTFHPKRLKETTWVADCGDPFMGNPHHNHPFYFKYVEKWFCKKTDFISIPIEEARSGYYAEFMDKIRIIPQGFKFNEPKRMEKFKPNNIPTFIYAGNFYTQHRNPKPLLAYLSNVDKDFLLKIYTKTKRIPLEFKEKLGYKLIVNDFIPREELIQEMKKADFLLNLENSTNKQSPSKLIDYALAGRPILSVNTNKEIDKEAITQFLNGDYRQRMIIEDIERYKIENVVEKFLMLEKK